MSREGMLKEEPARLFVKIDSPSIIQDIMDYYTNVLEYTEEDIARIVNLFVRDFTRIKSLFSNPTNIIKLK